MVKHGTCLTGCEVCGPCEHRSSIWQDSGSFECVNFDECGHFRYRLHCLTRNTFTPWGKPDEIAYKVDFSCKRCGSAYTQAASAQSFNSNQYYKRIRCCRGSFLFAVELTSNSVGSIVITAAQIAAILGGIQ